MWDQLRTDEYEGMLAETITMTGYNGDQIHAYLSRPLGKGPFPGIILIPHMPGWDEFCRETVAPVLPAWVSCSLSRHFLPVWTRVSRGDIGKSPRRRWSCR